MSKKLKIVAISDIHSQLPDIPECDILLISGDFVNSLKYSISENYDWLNTSFRQWLENIPAKHVVSVAGNHDFIFEHKKQPELPWHYLEDSGVCIEGVNIYGSPWQPVFGGWAFNANDSHQKECFDKIPDNTQILLTHSPPYKTGDFIPSHDYSVEHVGSIPLKNKVLNLPNLEVIVCGHIHNSYGQYIMKRDNYADVTVYNAALVNQNYVIVNKPFVFHI